VRIYIVFGGVVLGMRYDGLVGKQEMELQPVWIFEPMPSMPERNSCSLFLLLVNPYSSCLKLQ
jgi:hypothetical protein